MIMILNKLMYSQIAEDKNLTFFGRQRPTDMLIYEIWLGKLNLE